MKKLITFITILFISSTSYGSSVFYTSKYDRYFIKYCHTYFARALDWKWFKAQSIAESRLNPKAMSYVGAMGLMQLMPFTAKEVAKRLGIKNFNVTDPELNINFGIFYDRKMYSIWKAERGKERINFTFGSYNAGAGHIIKAQKKAKAKCLPTSKWESITRTLQSVTGKHSKETVTYVDRIDRYHLKLMTIPTKRQLLFFLFENS